jgi:hypothetical protein
MSHPYIALTVAQTYMENVYKLHGMPRRLFLIGTRYLPVSLERIAQIVSHCCEYELYLSPINRWLYRKVEPMSRNIFEILKQSYLNKWAHWLSLAAY